MQRWAGPALVAPEAGTLPACRRPQRWLLAGLAAALVWAGNALAIVHAQSDQTFAVYGQVSDGTAGATLPDGLQVQVAALSRERVEGTWDATVEPNGSYRVEGVPWLPGVIYMVGADYASARYADSLDVPEPADAQAAEAPLAIQKDLTVYEASVTDPGLRFDQSAVIVSQIDETQGTLSLLEIHTLTNPTDRTFTPRADGPGGPAGLLVFGLPPNAFDLSPDWGLDPSRIAQIDRGFASLTPVPPGQTQIVFRYQVPYTESVFRYQKSVRYPVTSFQVLAPLDGPKVESEDLLSVSTADIVGRQYRTLAGGPFGTGQAVRMAVTGLPIPGGPLAAIPPGSIAVAGSVLGLLLVLAGWWHSRRAPEADGDPVEQIVALDLEHEAGLIPEDAYRRARQALVEQAVAQSNLPAAG